MVKTKYKKFHSLVLEMLKMKDSSVDLSCAKSMNLQNEHQYEALRTNLEEKISSLHDNVQIHFYGSRIIGLANDESDLDIYVEIGDFFKVKKRLKFNKNFKFFF